MATPETTHLESNMKFRDDPAAEDSQHGHFMRQALLMVQCSLLRLDTILIPTGGEGYRVERNPCGLCSGVQQPDCGVWHE